MQFEKIEIKNFRGYYAENLLEFSNNENKPLTMVVGNQGGGKSSLMEAIQWCLYGEDIKQLRHVEAEGPAEVALTFTHEKKKYRALRQTEDNSTKALIMHSLESDGRQGAPLQMPQEIINNILPKALKGWFFYDAEDRENTNSKLDLKGGPETKKALRRIQGFEKIDTLIADLEKIIKSKERMQIQQGTNKKAKEIQAKIDILDNDINPLVKNNVGVEDDLERVRSKIKEKTDELTKLPESESIQKELNSLRPELVRNKKLEKSKESELNKFEASYLPIFLLKKAINKNQKPEQIKEGMIIVHEPDNTNLSDKIINDHKCICGREVLPGSKEEKQIKSVLLDKSANKEVNKFNQRASRVTNVLATIEPKYEAYKEEREILTNALEKIRRTIKDDEARIKKLDGELTKLAGTDQKVKVIKTLLGELEKKRVLFEKTLYINQGVIQTKNSEKSKLEIELRDADEKSAKSQSLTNLITKATKIRDYSIEKQKIDEKKALTTLSKDLNDAISKGAFKNISIKIKSEDYSIHVFDTDNEIDMTDALNDGLIELIKTCLIACVLGQSAKKTIAKNNYLAQPTAAPLVIDAPFTKMDAEYISSSLDLLLEKTEQLVLLSLPSTFKVYEKKALEKIGKKYVAIAADKGPQEEKKSSKRDIFGKSIDLVLYNNKNADGDPISQSILKEI